MAPLQSAITKKIRQNSISSNQSIVQADVDPEFALQERELFRFDRVMFGSDWPVCPLGIEYGEWVAWVEKATLGATEVLRRSLFYETAARFYRL